MRASKRIYVNVGCEEELKRLLDVSMGLQFQSVSHRKAVVVKRARSP
jgi:hypothetical protein